MILISAELACEPLQLAAKPRPPPCIVAGLKVAVALVLGKVLEVHQDGQIHDRIA